VNSTLLSEAPIFDPTIDKRWSAKKIRQKYGLPSPKQIDEIKAKGSQEVAKDIYKTALKNLPPALTVLLVALPSSLAIAVTSNCFPTQGIIALGWGGLVGSAFGGSSYNIFGPTTATGSNIFVENLSEEEKEVVAPFVAFLSGLMVIFLFYLMRLHKLVTFIPLAVSEGFKQSVGITLLLSQFVPGSYSSYCHIHSQCRYD